MQPTVAVLGLGSMGLGMAISLLRSGIAVNGYDIADHGFARLTSEGGGVSASPAEAAASADALLVVVVNAAQTERALLADDGALSAMKSGGVVISCATMAPKDAIRLAEAVEARGFHYLDAPISGGSKKAGTGELTVMKWPCTT